MIKFCHRCDTAHDPSRPCDPKGLKMVQARSSDGLEQQPSKLPVASSNLAAPTTDEISRVILDRGVAASVSDPVTVGPINRTDESASRQGEGLMHSAESVHPPQPFNRTTYQRDYMRDYPKAKSEGLTVKSWREKHKHD